ncbi:MAG: PQQ-dependent sugar dehydrogenase [Candidatus Eisenbacteria bacterium]|uniref:PQQ-dependent sugar dehydrogenase n=1 Tax=Eiseniibacteriota bacterium TaxID=2212470 RepID=A0A933SCL0_UNCEI|nr:PQQ-dependent sugar dehydrogenase [Candidatus Eisenbacteria bacterium]
MKALVCACALAASALLAAAADAQIVPTGFADQSVLSGLDVPVAIEFAPDGRLFVAEQLSGRVRLVVNGALASVDPVFTVPGVITGGEQGLLGVALDPQFPARPYLYTHQTDATQGVRISRWRLEGDLAFTGDGHLTVDVASRFDVIPSAPNAANNHNGGTVRFGPGGDLFVSLGEDATPCAAQDTSTLRGKILRLDVHALPDGPGAATRAQIAPAGNPFRASADSNAWLVYANGLRNPFRFQVDEIAQTLVIGDVGQNVYEELDLIDATGATSGERSDGAAYAGANFGWPWFEGAHAYDACAGFAPTLTAPIAEYDRSSLASASIISAGAYRSATADTTIWPSEYHGNLFWSEYYSGILVRLVRQGNAWVVPEAVAGQPSNGWGTGYRAASDWRVGPDGSLWYCRQYASSFRNSGSVRRILWSGGRPIDLQPPPATLRAYPAPAPGSVTLECGVGLREHLVLRIVDVRGRLVRRVELLGRRTVTWAWDGKDDAGRSVPSGMYFAKLDADGSEVSARIVLLQ